MSDLPQDVIDAIKGNTFDYEAKLFRRMRDLPLHQREFVMARGNMALGYIWGRQDESDKPDMLRAHNFKVFAMQQAYDYVTEREFALGTLLDQYNQWKEALA